MAHPVIQIMGYSESAMFMRGPQGPSVRAVISIHGAREFAVTCPESVEHRLVLQFDDTDSPDQRDLVSTYRALMQRRRDALNGRPLTPPTIDDARRIIEFGESVRKIDGTVLCQCHAGVSRSPAAALLCMAVWTGPGNENYCLQRIKVARPCTYPTRDWSRSATPFYSEREH